MPIDFYLFVSNSTKHLVNNMLVKNFGKGFREVKILGKRKAKPIWVATHIDVGESSGFESFTQ